VTTQNSLTMNFSFPPAWAVHFRYVLLIAIFVFAVRNIFSLVRVSLDGQATDVDTAPKRVHTKIPQQHNSVFDVSATLRSMNEEALLERGLLDMKTQVSFDYPVVPVGGYRACLETIYPQYSKPRHSSQVSYLGFHPGETCPDCVPLNASDSFVILSKAVCNSKEIVCGAGSSLICGLLAISTRTPMTVQDSELERWPRFMLDWYNFVDHSSGTIERNHRRLFDRQTILASHPLLMRRLANQTGHSFTVIYGGGCTARNKELPWKGNVGDIYGPHLGTMWAKELKLETHFHCFRTKNPFPDEQSLTLVGSIAGYVHKFPRNIILGPGTLGPNDLKIFEKGTYAIGVRGPRTRDQYLKRFGCNPEIVSDPGLYVGLVFEKEIREARASQERKQLCFISHEVDTKEMAEKLEAYKDISISAHGDIRKFIRFLATCDATVTSSLHGAIFSHALSAPSLPIQLSNKLTGGDWKFFDYYYGVNVTDFQGRHRLGEELPRSTDEWIELVHSFPQPKFPFDVSSALVTQQRFNTIFAL
jgi:pyruvyltransferase